MSHENVEIVRASIEAWNSADWDAALKDAAPDFELDLTRAVGPNVGTFSVDQVRRLWQDFAESWESAWIEPHDFVDAGEQVVVPWTLHARGRDGIAVETRVTWVWTIRDSNIVRVVYYEQRQEALEAVGQSE